MARLWSTGFELNSKTAGVEFEGLNGAASVSLSNTTVRTGMYALRINTTTTNSNIFQSVYGSNQARIGYFRMYFRLASLPSTIQNVFSFSTSGFGTRLARLQVTTTGALRLLNAGVAQVGSDSSVLSTNTWYRIEMKMDSTTSPGTLDAQIDGVSFASGNDNAQNTWAAIEVGWTNAVTVDSFFDDIALNDDTGSFQNSYPGAGSIIHLKPNTTGDSSGFLVNVGGTAGASNNFTRLNEVPPDDATSYNASVVSGASDLMNVDNAGLDVNAIINVVQVGGRFANIIADATSAFKLQIEKVTSGTISQSSAIVPNSTTWMTNAKAVPRLYPITLYQDPDNLNWTPQTIDSMQIGYVISTAGVNTIAISNVWALVESTAFIDVVPSISFNNYMFVRDGDPGDTGIMSFTEKIR